MLTEQEEQEGQVAENQQEQEGGSFMDEVYESFGEDNIGLMDDSEREEKEKTAQEEQSAEAKEEAGEKTGEEEDGGAEKEKETPDAEKKEETSEEEEAGKEGEKNKEDEEEENKLPENYQELVNTIKEIDPEAEIETVDDIVKYSKQIGEDLGKVKKENEENQKVYQEFVEVLENDPVAANFMNDLKNGASFEEAIVLNIDPENIDMDENPDLNKLKERKKERQEQYQQMRERQKEIEQNKDVSMQNIESFAKENEYDNKQMGSFIDNIRNFMNDYDKGLISKDFLQVLDKAMNAESQADKKAEAARIAARNEKLADDAMKRKKKQKGDGLPHLKGNNKVQEERKDIDEWTKSIENYEQDQVKL